ncbi:MAG: glutathione S-transferase family protein [Sandaracinaceae bacterium]
MLDAMSSITLYAAPMSSASPVLFAMAELGLPHESVPIDLKGDRHKQPDFLDLNPMGQVPTLVVDGHPIFESSACLAFLGERFGRERGLWPDAGSAEHMRALTWLAWSAVTLGHTIRQCFANGEHAPEDMRNAKQLEAGRARYGELLRILDGHLGQHAFVAGEAFTLADCHASANVGWSARVLELDLATTPRVAAWLETCFAREAAQAM